MKRLFPGLLVIMGFLTILSSCYKPTPPVSSPTGYVLATHVAYGALQSDPNPDSLIRAEMQLLSSKPDPESSSSATYVSCCCPCPAQTAESGSDTTHCPCPSLSETKIVAPDKGMEYIRVDGTEMESSDPPAADSLRNVKIYQLPSTAKLPDGTHELIIKGDLTGSGVKEYKLMIETVDGKTYKKNANE